MQHARKGNFGSVALQKTKAIHPNYIGCDGLIQCPKVFTSHLIRLLLLGFVNDWSQIAQIL